MDLRIDPACATSPSRQIVEGVLDALASGRLKPGDRLPSVRGLAAQVLVNPNTVGKSYRDLEALGVVASRMGDGVFVTPEGPETAGAARRDATLAAVRDAARAALRAGHTVQDVIKQVAAIGPRARAATGTGT